MEDHGLGLGIYHMTMRESVKRFNAVAWVAEGISWRSGRIQDAADLTTLLCGEFFFFLQILKKTTCIRLEDTEEEILHKDTSINDPDRTFKLNKFWIPFGYPFMRLLTGTATSYTEIQRLQIFPVTDLWFPKPNYF